MPSPPGAPAPKLLREPSREMRFHARWLTRLLALGGRPSAVQGMVAAGMVTPTAHFANLTVEFQAYLFDVFHQTTFSRVVHAVLQPLTVVCLLAGLAPFELTLFDLVPGLSWAWIGAAGLGTWYLVQGFASSMRLLGVVSAAFAVLAAALGLAWFAAFGAGDSGYSLATNPWLIGFALSCLVTLSHTPEPKVPPRLNGRRTWSGVSAFFRHVDGRPSTPADHVRGLFRILLLGLTWGLVNEIWAFWRLTPITFLHLLWALGYQPERRAALQSDTRDAIASGDPALDYVGTGGSTPLVAVATLRNTQQHP